MARMPKNTNNIVPPVNADEVAQEMELSEKLKVFADMRLRELIDARKAAGKPVVSPATLRCVLWVLINRSDRDGLCWPGQARLEAESECDEASVRRAVKIMEDEGILDNVDRRSTIGGHTKRYVKGDTTSGSTNRYWLNWDRVRTLAALGKEIDKQRIAKAREAARVKASNTHQPARCSKPKNTLQADGCSSSNTHQPATCTPVSLQGEQQSDCVVNTRQPDTQTTQTQPLNEPSQEPRREFAAAGGGCVLTAAGRDEAALTPPLKRPITADGLARKFRAIEQLRQVGILASRMEHLIAIASHGNPGRGGDALERVMTVLNEAERQGDKVRNLPKWVDHAITEQLDFSDTQSPQANVPRRKTA